MFVTNNTMSVTNTLSLVSRQSRRFASSAPAATVSAWYHFHEGGDGSWGLSKKTSINLHQVEKIELHKKQVHFILIRFNFWRNEYYKTQHFATPEGAETAYTALMKQLDELR